MPRQRAADRAKEQRHKPTIGGGVEAITKAASAVDSVVAVVDYLVANQTIKPDVGSLVKLALEAQREALEPAIKANVHT